VAASAAVRAPLLGAPPISDEAAHLLGSWTLLDGGRLYVDFVDNKPPLLYGAYALPQLVLGRGIRAVRLFAFLVVVPLTAFAASAFFGYERRGLIAATLCVIAPAAATAEDALPVHSELLMLLPAAWAAVLLRRREPSRPAGGLDVVAGGLLGIAALVKPTALPWAAAAPLALLACDRSAAGVRLAARAALAAAAGVALPLLATVVVFAWAGSLGDLVERTLLANVRYVAAPLTPLEAASRAARGALPWLAATAPLWWAWARGRSGASGFPRGLVNGLLLLSIPAVLVGGRFYGHYFLQALFPLCLAAAPVLARPERPARTALSVFGVTVAGFTLVNAWLVHARDDVVEDTHPLHRNVATFVRADPCFAGATLFVWGLAPRLYVEIGLAPASRFVLPQETISGHQPGRRAPSSRVRAEDRRLLLEDLERRSATYILDLAPSGFHRWDRFPLTTFPELLDLVRREYEIAGVVDGVVIHRRLRCRPLPAARVLEPH
jgi:hypothetical protein